MAGKNPWDELPDYAPQAAAKPKAIAKKAEWDSLPDYEPPKSDITGAAQAALEHFGNQASFGYMPQIQGMVSQMVPDPNADLDAKMRAQGFNIVQKKPNYIEDRDAYIKRLQQQELEHPLASAGGSVAGALTAGIATSGLTPINAASRIGRVAQAAKAGALVGAISNPGDTEGEVNGLQFTDRLGNAGTGAGIGAAGQGLIEGFSAGARSAANLPSALQNKAEERAFKSSGAMLKDYRSAYGQGRINEVGRYMLDNDLVKPGMSVKDIADAAEKLQETHGKAIGSILDGLDQTGAKAPAHADLAAEIDKIASPLKGLKTAQPTYGSLVDVADDIRAMGNGKNPTFGGAQDVKQFISDQIQKVGGWKTPNPSEKNLALRQAYGAVNGAIEDAGARAAETVGDKNLLDTYLANKSGYRNATEVARIANDQALRQNANNFFSLGDKLGAGAGFIGGFSSGHDMKDRIEKGFMGAGAGLALKGARTYGTPMVSTALDNAGAFLANTPLGKAGKLVAPIMNATERAPIGAAVAEGVISQPRLDPRQLRSVASKDGPVGEDKWAQDGIQKLGLDEDLAGKILSDPRGKQLLIQASDLQPNSKAMKQIQNQIQKGWGK